jgi:predicted naringenin-chalcone synthase
MKTIETMKTKKAMKTKTNFRKAALRSAAVVVSFILVSITVSAQEFWKKVLTHSSFNEIAIAMVETSEKKSPVNGNTEIAFWYAFDKAFDPALELEGWMTSENYFSPTVFSIENEVEVPLALESWMLDESLFYTHEVQEEPLMLESWMITAIFWSM